MRGVFLTRPLPEDPAALADATLLLTRSFVADGLMDQDTQDAMFRAVAAKYADGPLYIKTHPRDTTDYQALFPGAVVLERTMPSEVLNFACRANSAGRSPCKAGCCGALPQRRRISSSRWRRPGP